jgi:two-component system, OmpR family, alkaline phosphatase synthesis response regulator PhoP
MQQRVPTILQVEDEENIRKLITVNLVERGYHVVETYDGQQGLDYLRDQKPDLLILNILLPDISGLDLLDQLDENSAQFSDLPVILITASEVDKNRIVNEHPRVIRIFTKPFDVKEVVDFIHQKIPKDKSST